LSKNDPQGDYVRFEESQISYEDKVKKHKVLKTYDSYMHQNFGEIFDLKRSEVLDKVNLIKPIPEPVPVVVPPPRKRY